MIFHTITVWALGLPITIFLFAVVLLTLVVDRSGDYIHSIGSFWSRVIVWLAGVRVDARGLENIPDGPVIFASNHRGAFDIPVLQGHLRVQFRWIAKKSLLHIPVIGWTMRLAGYITIDRTSASRAFRSIEAAAAKIKDGRSVLIFPEGTRNTEPDLLPFKRGPFMLAELSGAPIVPIAITGTELVMQKGNPLIRPAKVVLTIGKPIDAKGVEGKELKQRTRAAIEGLLHGPGQQHPV